MCISALIISKISITYQPKNFTTMAEISQTLLYDVSFHEHQIKVMVTKKALEVDQWIGQTVHIHKKRLHKLLIGLDIEWRHYYPNDNTPIALLQLCIGSRCLIFQLLHKDCIPVSLLAFLGNPNFTFVGVGIQGDVEKLFQDHSLVVANYVELNQLALVVREVEEYGKMGLKKMACEVLGKVMEKPLNVTLSQWNDKDLSYEQVEYACIDAFVSFEIGMKLFTELFNRMGSPASHVNIAGLGLKRILN